MTHPSSDETSGSTSPLGPPLAVRERARRIGIVVEGTSHYSTGVKPFVWLGRGLAERGHRISFAALNCGEDARDALRREVPGATLTDVSTIRDVVAHFRADSPDMVVADDFFRNRLPSLSEVKRRLSVPVVAYVHILFGTAAFRKYDSFALPVTARARLAAAQLVPFKLLGARYRQELHSVDCRVANSMFTSMLANLLYQAPTSHVIYPPANPAIFATDGVESHSHASTFRIVVFVEHATDPDPHRYLPVLEALARQGASFDLIGDPMLTEALARNLPRGTTQQFTGIRDDEIWRLFDGATATYLPQDWDTFNNMGPESILRGTPVVCRVHQPWMEITGRSSAYLAATTDREAVDGVLGLSNVEEREWRRLARSLREAIHPEAAAIAFEQVITTVTRQGPDGEPARGGS